MFCLLVFWFVSTGFEIPHTPGFSKNITPAPCWSVTFLSVFSSGFCLSSSRPQRGLLLFLLIQDRSGQRPVGLGLGLGFFYCLSSVSTQLRLWLRWNTLVQTMMVPPPSPQKLEIFSPPKIKLFCTFRRLESNNLPTGQIVTKVFFFHIHFRTFSVMMPTLVRISSPYEDQGLILIQRNIIFGSEF